MRRFNLHAVLLVVMMLMTNMVQAQQPRYWQQIQEFKQQDSISFPKKNSILFVGSSSFRLWKDVQSSFPGFSIINRGFGGSTLPEVELYANDIIFPYKPKQIVIYCGENDLAGKDINADSVMNRFQSLYQTIRSRLRKVPIVYVSMKPSPSRQHLMSEMKRANDMIRNFLEGQKKAEFVDVYSLMLDQNGMPRTDIFVKDMLHMNEKGYDIWESAIAPYLKK